MDGGIVDPLDQAGDLLRVGPAVDPVAEVENVPAAQPSTLREDPVDRRVEHLAGREEGGRVQIPLQRVAAAERNTSRAAAPVCRMRSQRCRMLALSAVSCDGV